jgi:hypothetical protein
MAPSHLGPVIAALTAPVPMLTVSYAVEFGCDSGIAAVACNISCLVRSHIKPHPERVLGF